MGNENRTSGVMIRKKKLMLFDWVIVTNCANCKEVIYRIVRMVS